MFKGIIIGFSLATAMVIGGAYLTSQAMHLGGEALIKGIEQAMEKQPEYRGTPKAVHVENTCHERLDMSYAECINEFYPD